MSRFLRIAATGLLLIYVGAARGRDDSLTRVLNGPANLEALSKAYAELGGKPCRSALCLSIRDIATSFETIEERHPPDAQTLLNPDAFDARAWVDEHDLRLKQLLDKGRGRWLLYCSILRKLAYHYSDYSIGYSAVEVASRISDPSFDCAAVVIPAFPDTPEIRGLLKDALETCESDRHPGCAYIKRAMQARNMH